jgi:hypothetical protein
MWYIHSYIHINTYSKISSSRIVLYCLYLCMYVCLCLQPFIYYYYDYLMHACMNICMCVCNGRIDSEYDVERLQRWSGLCFGILLLDISGFGCARVLSLDRGDPHGGPGRLVMGMLLL